MRGGRGREMMGAKGEGRKCGRDGTGWKHGVEELYKGKGEEENRLGRG